MRSDGETYEVGKSYSVAELVSEGGEYETKRKRMKTEFDIATKEILNKVTEQNARDVTAMNNVDEEKPAPRIENLVSIKHLKSKFEKNETMFGQTQNTYARERHTEKEAYKHHKIAGGSSTLEDIIRWNWSDFEDLMRNGSVDVESGTWYENLNKRRERKTSGYYIPTAGTQIDAWYRTSSKYKLENSNGGNKITLRRTLRYCEENPSGKISAKDFDLKEDRSEWLIMHDKLMNGNRVDSKGKIDRMEFLSLTTLALSIERKNLHFGMMGYCRNGRTNLLVINLYQLKTEKMKTETFIRWLMLEALTPCCKHFAILNLLFINDPTCNSNPT